MNRVSIVEVQDPANNTVQGGPVARKVAMMNRLRGGPPGRGDGLRPDKVVASS